MSDSTTRFSDRVENYVKYRPSYPPEVLDTLKSECGLTADSIIADIGSGTGILTKPFLENGNSTFAIEPNKEMREAAEESLRAYPNFNSVGTTAEATTLENDSIDIIIAGQAFHWFDRLKCKSEFRRILKSSGWIVLIWNERLTAGSTFQVEYENVLKRLGNDYQTVNHKNIGHEIISDFFHPHDYKTRCFSNYQRFDLQGLIGRCLSSSYAPAPEEPNHNSLLLELEKLFNAFEDNGRVCFEYETRIYIGQ